MTRGISDAAPIPEDKPGDAGPDNKEILQYLDELSDFVRELDIRLATIEKFAIKEIPSQPKSKPKNFFTGK
jgi:hypothetical protein